MTKHRKYVLIWLLLPLLLLRGLVPTGFMIDASGDGLSLVICSGSVKTHAMGSDHSGHAGHAAHSEHSGHVDHSGHGADALKGAEHPAQQEHGNSICPFAAAASVAPMPSVLPILASTLSDVGAIASDVAKFVSPFGPSRVQQSRAPPLFS